MPFPNEHSARITHPGQYTKFTRKNIAPGIDTILGIKEGKSEVQAYRFAINKFTVEQAKIWLKEHKIKAISFESAKSEGGQFSLQKETFSVDDKMVFKAGTWEDAHGSIDNYTTDDLDDMIKAFNDLKDVRNFPLKLGHGTKQNLLKSEGLPAAGWIKSLKRIGDALYASFTGIPKVIKELIENKAYRNVSSEIIPCFKDYGIDVEFPLVLSAVTLLGAELPSLSGLGDFSSLYISEQEAKIYNLVIDEENSIRNNIAKEFKLVNKSKREEIMEKEQLEAANKQLTEEKVELEKKYAAMQKEAAIDKEKLVAIDKEKADLESEAHKKGCKEFVAAQVKDGKLLPKDIEKVTSILYKMQTEEAKEYKEVLASQPNIVEMQELSKNIASKAKDMLKEFKIVDGMGSENEQKQHCLILRYMEKDGKLSYGDAMLNVEKSNPELFKEED